MRYKRKPTIVKAERWFPGKIVEGVREININGEIIGVCVTMHGQDTKISPGDYVIEEPDGIHHYPCKPDIFEKNYELYSESM